MIIEIDKDGYVVIIVDKGVEAYAVKCWISETVKEDQQDTFTIKDDKGKEC